MLKNGLLAQVFLNTKETSAFIFQETEDATLLREYSLLVRHEGGAREHTDKPIRCPRLQVQKQVNSLKFRLLV